jgi:manganese efflux pump family protein
MGIYAIFLLSIGLSLDTFAVSVSCGLIDKDIKFFHASRIAIIFAIFQAVMPIIGWLLGLSVKGYIIQVDHWMAFGLLSLVGLKMIYESLKNNEEKNFNPQDIKVILILSVATTIDAFVIGITFAFLEVNLLLASLIIGAVTYTASMLGTLFGKNVGAHFGKKMEIVGGLILISIGTKILIEHLFK